MVVSANDLISSQPWVRPLVGPWIKGPLVQGITKIGIVLGCHLAKGLSSHKAIVLVGPQSIPYTLQGVILLLMQALTTHQDHFGIFFCPQCVPKCVLQNVANETSLCLICFAQHPPQNVPNSTSLCPKCFAQHPLETQANIATYMFLCLE